AMAVNAGFLPSSRSPNWTSRSRWRMAAPSTQNVLWGRTRQRPLWLLRCSRYRNLKLALVFAAALVAASSLPAPPAQHPPAELLGLWRGTSQCTDRVAAPACNDEEIVYVFTAGSAPGAIRWKADKVVDGARQSMGDPLDVAWNGDDACWKA